MGWQQGFFYSKYQARPEYSNCGPFIIQRLAPPQATQRLKNWEFLKQTIPDCPGPVTGYYIGKNAKSDEGYEI